jgi:hypothetical protein
MAPIGDASITPMFVESNAAMGRAVQASSLRLWRADDDCCEVCSGDLVAVASIPAHTSGTAAASGEMLRAAADCSPDYADASLYFGKFSRYGAIHVISVLHGAIRL